MRPGADGTYSYREAGFNQFFSKSIASNPEVRNLRTMGSGSRNNQLAFDRVQVGGSLGDKIRVGDINNDGVNAVIDITDGSGNVIARLGRTERS